MAAKTLQDYYNDGYYGMLDKIQESIWQITAPNGSGPWSEGQFDAAEEIGEIIKKKIRGKIILREERQRP